MAKKTPKRAWAPEHVRTLKLWPAKRSALRVSLEASGVLKALHGKRHLAWGYRWTRASKYTPALQCKAPLNRLGFLIVN